jgi:hypothetical protein
VAYLLRMWQATGEDGMAWRASLESAGTGERVGFAELEDLFRFLEREARGFAQDQASPRVGGKWRDSDE